MKPTNNSYSQACTNQPNEYPNIVLMRNCVQYLDLLLADRLKNLAQHARVHVLAIVNAAIHGDELRAREWSHTQQNQTGRERERERERET